MNKIITAALLQAAVTGLPAMVLAQDAAISRPDCAAQPMMMNHAAQPAEHDMSSCPRLPVTPGQSAYATIQEVVALLKADSTTDWSRVNIEALRQHLIDMDDVTMRAAVMQHDIPGGMEAKVIGTGRTAAAIRRMLAPHAAMLDMSPEYSAAATPVPGGILLRVTAKDAGDVRLVQQIRGLGFAGLLTEGDHHAAHHLAIARGEAEPHKH